MFSLQQFFGYVPLTEQVTRVMGGIPKVLPDPFYSLTRDIPGDRYRRATKQGTRKLAQVSRYGSPPRNVARMARGIQDLVMVHTIEQIQAGHELLTLLRQWDDYVIQQMARDLLREDAQNFGLRMDNLRTAVIQASLAFGKVWFDADGNLQLTSGGADLEIDYGVPSTNTGQINPGSGAIIGASWATASTDIVGHVNKIKTYAVQKTGRRLKYAFYGSNVGSYLANNDSFKYYLARNPQMNARYVDTARLDGEYLELLWVPVQEAFFEDTNGTIQPIYPADGVTFYPEVTRENYELMQGGYPVPKTFGVAPDLEGLAAQLDYVYGVFKYGYMMPGTLQLNMAQGDTFLPDHKVPESIFIADVTP